MSEVSLIEKMRAAGVAKAVAEYNGQGDSGDVEGVTLYDAEGGLVELPVVEPSGRTARYMPRRSELESEIADFVANAIPYDWYNNEGGYGDATIEVATGRCVIDGYKRVEHADPMPSEVAVP